MEGAIRGARRHGQGVEHHACATYEPCAGVHDAPVDGAAAHESEVARARLTHTRGIVPMPYNDRARPDARLRDTINPVCIRRVPHWHGVFAEDEHLRAGNRLSRGGHMPFDRGCRMECNASRILVHGNHRMQWREAIGLDSKPDQPLPFHAQRKRPVCIRDRRRQRRLRISQQTRLPVRLRRRP